MMNKTTKYKSKLEKMNYQYDLIETDNLLYIESTK